MADPQTDGHISRRGLLRAATGSGAAGLAASNDVAAQETTTVAATDELVFDPAEVQVSPGTTVTWENVGSIDHSVTAYGDDIPDEAEYWATGDFSSESAARDAYPDEGVLAAGDTYEHTFEVEGTHDYFCIPHEQVGMVGTVTVSGGGGGGTEGGGDGGGGGGGGPTLPDSARSLGLAASFVMAATLGLAYFFIKYGGDYGEFEE